MMFWDLFSIIASKKKYLDLIRKLNDGGLILNDNYLDCVLVTIR